MSEPPEPVSMIAIPSTVFRKARAPAWAELERLLSRAQYRSVKSLNADELQRLPLLYRAALSSLSVARATALDRHLLLYLEELALRAYFVVYGPRESLWAGCRRFFATGFPAAVRAARWHILVSLLAVIAGTVAGFALVASDETWFSEIVPAGLAAERGATSTRQELLSEEIFAPWPGVATSFLVFANFLFQHNTSVGILCFSLGIVGGIPTLILLVYQGLIFGAFIGLHYDRGLALDFLGWVSIHGVTEFGATILCGAGGLMIGEKAVFPGRRGRIEELVRGGGTAAKVALGAMLMFFVAAILEGVFRQLVQSTTLRLAIGVGTAVLWGYYFTPKLRRS